MAYIFEKFDIWGSNINFLINKKDSLKSWQGGITSLIFLSAAMLYIAFQLYYWLTLSYTTKISQTNYISNNIVDIQSLSDFMIAFCPGSASNSTAKDPIVTESLNMTLEWHYFIRNPWLFEDKVYINLTQCTDDMFPSFVSNTYDVRLFRGCTCARKEDLNQFNITYFFSNSYVSYLQYIAKFNDNILKNNTLYQKYFDYYSSNTPRLFTYFIDAQGNIDDYKNPFDNYINYQYSYLNPDASVQTDLFFNKLTVQSDDVFIGNGKIYYLI